MEGPTFRLVKRLKEHPPPAAQAPIWFSTTNG